MNAKATKQEAQDDAQENDLVMKIELEGEMREVHLSDKIEYVQDNPKREGTKIHKKYESYKGASTIAELKELFGTGWKAAVKYDAPRGFLKFV